MKTQNALQRLLDALDKAEDGCQPGFFGPGYQNGHGVEVGAEIQAAREAARTLARLMATGEPIGEIVRSCSVGSGLQVKLKGNPTSDMPGMVGLQLYPGPNANSAESKADDLRLNRATLEVLRSVLQCTPGESVIERAERLMGTVTAMTSGMISAPAVADDVVGNQARYAAAQQTPGSHALGGAHFETFMAGEPPCEQETAWLLLRRPSGDGEDAAIEVVLALDCPEGELSRWHVCADWKAESAHNAIDHEGPCEIIGWLPYRVPAPAMKTRIQLEASQQNSLGTKIQAEGDDAVWGWAIVDAQGRARFTRPYRAFLGAAAINTRAFTVEEVLAIDRSSPSGAPHKMLTLTARTGQSDGSCTGARAGEAPGADVVLAAARYWAINTPEIEKFLSAVHNEALHQRERWCANGDDGKTDADWFWLVGHLAGKAIHTQELSKKLHHIITSAAALLNWHAARVGAYQGMRPGIATPAASEVGGTP